MIFIHSSTIKTLKKQWQFQKSKYKISAYHIVIKIRRNDSLFHAMHIVLINYVWNIRVVRWTVYICNASSICKRSLWGCFVLNALSLLYYKNPKHQFFVIVFYRMSAQQSNYLFLQQKSYSIQQMLLLFFKLSMRLTINAGSHVSI